MQCPSEWWTVEEDNLDTRPSIRWVGRLILPLRLSYLSGGRLSLMKITNAKEMLIGLLAWTLMLLLAALAVSSGPHP